MLHLKKVCCLLLCLVCLALTACNSTDVLVENEKYKLYTKDGTFYMSIKEVDVEETPEDLFINRAFRSVSFASVAEMKSDILTGNFTEEEWREISWWVKEPMEFEIMDLNALLEPVYPDSSIVYPSEIKCKVAWSRFARYSFSIYEVYGNLTCSLSPSTRETNETWADRYLNWKDYLVEEYSSVEADDVRVEQEAERNATVYYREEYKDCIYTIEKDGRLFYVHEEYRLISGTTPGVFKDTPTTTTVYGEYNGQYYKLKVNSRERPSIELLTSFGLVPYEG